MSLAHEFQLCGGGVLAFNIMQTLEKLMTCNS